MSLEIDGYVQWLLFAKAILFGGCLGVFYDFFRFLRVMRKFGKYFVMVQDIIYWCVSALAVFAFMMIYSNGIVRIYLLIGIFLGEIFYYFSLGKIMFMLFRFIKKIVEEISTFFKKHVFMPVINFLNKYVFSHIKNIFKRIKINIRKNLKKIFLQKQKTPCK